MLSAARRAYLAAWRERNREKTRAAQRAYYARYPERCAAAVAASRKANPEPSRAATQRYAAANRDVVLDRRRGAYQRDRAVEIARVRTRQGKIRHGALWTTPAQQAEIDGLYLFTSCFPWFEVDHIAPLKGKTASGLHVLGNLQVITRAENRAKGNKFCPAAVELATMVR